MLIGIESTPSVRFLWEIGLDRIRCGPAFGGPKKAAVKKPAAKKAAKKVAKKKSR